MTKLLHNNDNNEKTVLYVLVWSVIYLIINPIIVKRSPMFADSWALISLCIMLTTMNDKTEAKK